MKIFFNTIILFLLITFTLTSCKIKNNFETDKITIHYGSIEKENYIEITDKETINSIKDFCQDFDFKKVPKEKMLEGLCSIFIDFNNGTVIGMYENIDYGNIDGKIELVGTAVYLPEGFNNYIKNLIENN